MSKKNKILVACLALLLTLSVGYALFSETIEINGTATAKGEFNYKIETYVGAISEINNSMLNSININSKLKTTKTGDVLYSSYIQSNHGVTSSNISNNGNNVVMSTSFNYPGASQYYTVKITNIGSIPFTIDLWDKMINETSVTGTLTGIDGVSYDMEKIKDMVNETSGIFTVGTYTEIAKVQARMITLKNAITTNDIYTDYISRLETDTTSLPILKTNQYMYLIFNMGLDSSLGHSGETTGFDISGTSNVSIPFVQVTAN